ncbi:MAG: HDOD domain-containing protein [Phycisphaerales bacterium]|nr:HDOD domain-containing protein [Phycisphaerales bacterium]
MRGQEAGRRVDLILEQIETLPTLSAIAVRLLSITSDDEADVREVVRLVASDPALTTKLLRLCRSARGGIGRAITTVDRAVVMLGLDAVRSAILSIQVYETLSSASRDETDDKARVFDRPGFWRHSIAVAVACKLITEAHHEQARTRRSRCELPKGDEAYVAGLLHDLGKIALDVIMPKSFDRVVTLAEQYQVCMAEVERRVIGVDHHTAGKRLGEYWRLPHTLQDVMWMHGQPFDALPDLPHRNLVALVTTADLLVRRQHIGFSGNRMRGEDLDATCRECGLDPELVRGIVSKLHETSAEHASSIGLDDAPSQELFLASIGRANEALGRLNVLLEERSSLSMQQGKVIGAISDFNAAAAPGRSVIGTLGEVVRSATNLLGDGLYLMLYQSRRSDTWQVYQFSGDGRMLRNHDAVPPTGCKHLADLSDEGQVSMRTAAVLPWLTDYLGDAVDMRDVQLIPLCCAWGVAAVLVHDFGSGVQTYPQALLGAITTTWASAIAGAAQHAGAKSLGEQLVEANRVLAETQHKLTDARAMARLGEMAKGAAHEMNNPLTIISGRSQILVSRLAPGEGQEAAQAIVEQAHRLSDLITSLHLFADPPTPARHETDLRALITELAKDARRQFPDVKIVHDVPDDVGKVWIDPTQVSEVLAELIQNAGEAQPRSFVRVAVQADPLDGRLVIVVEDDGVGMDARCLEHAFDPFFSVKPAGRQAGLGLARAQRLIEGQGGTIELSSESGEGSTARIAIPHWRKDQSPHSAQDAA